MKKQPERMCVVCRQMQDKKNLLRLVKNKDGEIFIDKTYKANGRGAYICHNEECVKKLIKNKILNKVFEKSINEEVYNSIMEELLAEK